MKRWIVRVVVGVLAAGLVATGPGGKRNPPVAHASGADLASCEAQAGRITIATANVGGAFFPIGGGIAKLINENTKLRAAAAETGGSGQNIQQLVNGDYDIAFAGADIALDAVTGRGLFDDKPQSIRALARLYLEYIRVLVRAGAGIDSVEDLRGKRVAIGSPKSGTELTARRLLRAAGLDPDNDIQAQRLDLAKSADGFKNGAVDAIVRIGPLRSPQITQIVTFLGGKVKFLDLTPQFDEMNEADPVYERGVSPAGTNGQSEDVPTIVVPALLVVREDFPGSAACAVTKLIFEKRDELKKVHPSAKDITLASAGKTGHVPLHSGARDALDALGARG